MKKSMTVITTIMVMITTGTLAQTAFKEHKAGHVFYVSLPEYMTKTSGLNAVATIQFINVEKDVAGFVITDTKEELQLAEISYESVNQFYNDFIIDFAKDEKKRTVTTPISKNIGTSNFMECDVSYYDKELKIEIYYLVGIVETPTSYYKILCWATLENKDTYKSDFQKILYSLKD